MQLFINGKETDITEFQADELQQAVLISLFSWAKSHDDDGVVAPYRQGWWGDTFSNVSGDRIGSRLWLLQREKLTNEAVSRAKSYAEEALQWLVDDSILESFEVYAEREGTRLNMSVTCYKPRDAQAIEARFLDVWG
jgi:phage gp46-like protein